jgi:hypothetical protein
MATYGTSRVAKAVLIAAVPLIMLKSKCNPEGQATAIRYPSILSLVSTLHHGEGGSR